MGRKSKLTPAQWDEIERRLIAGDSRRALGREFKVSETTIREHFDKHHDTVEAVADAIVAAEIMTEKAQERLEALPPLAQISAQNLAGARKRIADNFAVGLDYGADTFARAQQMGNRLVRQAEADPINHVDKLKLANGLIDTGNRAMATVAGKEALLQVPDEGGDDGAPVIYLPSNGR